MSSKNKNPLYVVNSEHVEVANGVLDFVIKKFNLAPVVELINSIIKILLEQVNSYPMFNILKQFIDLLVARLELFQRVSVI